MKIIHIADLHLGKSVHGVSMLENGDQGYWVDRFLELADEERPDAVLIAGDVYDRSAPSGDAVTLLSRFLTGLSGMEIPVMMVAGNHDSVQRLSFVKSLLARQGIYISGALTGDKEITHVTLHDEYGEVVFWLMPYVFPALAAEALRKIDDSFSDSVKDSESAVRALLQRQPVDYKVRNVLIAHQNVTAGGVSPEQGGSETMVGGVGQIDYTVFDGFDYVALGHIHAAYPVGRNSVRYAGSPLCYHFNETRQKAKGPVILELSEKGSPVQIETKIISPLHPMREIRGAYEEIVREELDRFRTGEYIRVVLTDRRISPEISSFFRDLCEKRDSILMELCSEYSQAHGETAALTTSQVREKSVEELFEDFYTERFDGEQPSEKDLSIMKFAGEQMRRADTGSAPDADQIERLLRELIGQQ